MGMLTYAIVKAYGCTDSTWNDPSARVSSLLYVEFAIASAECVFAAESGAQSTNSVSPGVNGEETCTSLSY